MPKISTRSQARIKRSDWRRIRANLRVEVLETRCLMSGWTPKISSLSAVGFDAWFGEKSPPVESQAFFGPRASVSQTQDGEYAKSIHAAGDASQRGGPWARTDAGTTSRIGTATYVIVPETTAPHHTLATAQNLPDLSYFGVVGAIGGGGLADLYRMTLGTDAERLDFSLTTNQSGLVIPVQFELFDSTGHALGVWSTGGQGNSSLDAQLSNVPAGTTLYLGVAVGNQNGGGGSSQAIEYQLWISHEPAPGSPSVDPSAGITLASTAIMPVISSALGAATGLAAVPSNGNAQANAGSPENPEDGAHVAVGSAAVRSARPSGGLLSDSDPTPPAAHDYQRGRQQRVGRSLK